MNSDKAVVLRTFANEVDANIAASSLRSQGIETHIQKDDCGGAIPSLQMAGGVRLLVKPEDLGDAEKILNEIEVEYAGKVEQEDEQEDRKGTKSSPMRILRRAFLFLGCFSYFLWICRTLLANIWEFLMVRLVL
ncbi:MAG: putative signal transducing protein [Desulfomonilaceae bacterium]